MLEYELANVFAKYSLACFWPKAKARNIFFVEVIKFRCVSLRSRFSLFSSFGRSSVQIGGAALARDCRNIRVSSMRDSRLFLRILIPGGDADSTTHSDGERGSREIR